jgi:hypothetical protein
MGVAIALGGGRFGGTGLRGEQCGESAFVLEGESDRFDLLRRAVGEVAQGAVFDLAVLAEGIAQQDPGVGGALGRSDGCNIEIHGEHTNIAIQIACQGRNCIKCKRLVATNLRRKILEILTVQAIHEIRAAHRAEHPF